MNFEYPSWNGDFGGFIEGPVNQEMLSDKYKMINHDFRKAIHKSIVFI